MKSFSCIILPICMFLFLAYPEALRAEGNLLRNSAFQEDWVTRRPDIKNHHWCFQMDHVNRRDYTPDAWSFSGNWEWRGADRREGERELVLSGQKARVAQRVNWVDIWNESKHTGVGDAGTSPTPTAAASMNPERMVRTLTLRAQVSGRDVPENAGRAVVAWQKDVAASVALPAGAYEDRWIEVTLPASVWLDKAKVKPEGPWTLPREVEVAVEYNADIGEITIKDVVLTADAPDSPNLLANGGFEDLDPDGYPKGWSRPRKYTYFPPRNYYIFNTWHNAPMPNRGRVAADSLVVHDGAYSLQMRVPSGDEKYVASDPIVLNQTEARLIEVQAWVKTEHINYLQIDGEDQDGKRLWGRLWINKLHRAELGSDDWMLIRQVFKPQAPVKAFTLKLCARGVNGYTLDDTGDMPQANACGTIWWDNLQVFEPESTVQDLASRNAKAIPAPGGANHRVRLANLRPGARLFGENVLSADIVNPGNGRTLALKWTFTSPSGETSEYSSTRVNVPRNGSASVAVPYTITEGCPAYTEYKGRLSLVDDKGREVNGTDLGFATWTRPVHIEMGSLYRAPDRPQYVRLNLGLAPATMARAAKVNVDAIRRRTGKTVQSWTIAATPQAIMEQRRRIPTDVVEDFRNLLLADLDLSKLPVQPFDNPQRNWIMRFTVVDAGGKALATADSDPFCRLAGFTLKQPPIEKVHIDEHNLLYVNDKPWMPWGWVYGYCPTYDGPAESGTYLDMRNVGYASGYSGWTMGERETGAYNSHRTIEHLTPTNAMQELWEKTGKYVSSAFPTHGAARFLPASYDDAYLQWCRTAPMVVSVAAGCEETFGMFHSLDDATLENYKAAAEKVRTIARKPVMIGHGGYWNRYEWKIGNFFDLYDPETEPFYPAHLHTDWLPLFKGQKKAVWLRPQMYESVPYERMRFHIYVEAMRGCRGWQFAHGTGDKSLFAGLRAELRMLEPALYSKDMGPEVRFEPWVERFSRKHDGHLYIIAASTHGMTLGNWRWTGETDGTAGRVRITASDSEFRSDSNNYAADFAPPTGPRTLGVQYLPDARAWPEGTRLTQWIKPDPAAAPGGLAVLVKADGRWTHTGAWGEFNRSRFAPGGKDAHWFMTTFYRHAQGFAFDGWLGAIKKSAEPYLPGTAADIGALPDAGKWTKLEIPLEQLGAGGKRIDGLAFMHENGTVLWGRTAFVTPDGKEDVVWDQAVGPAIGALADVKVTVDGLKEGTAVEVLFEDREIKAGDGFFMDDFSGEDLYQRFGGGPNNGYGDKPVALHIYKINM